MTVIIDGTTGIDKIQSSVVATSATSVSGTSTSSIQNSALGSGTPNSTTYLRGDRTWTTVAEGVTSVDGNTGAVTATQLLTSIKTVDGTGSLLDADLLDGSHASAFAPASGGNYVAKDNGHAQVGSVALLGYDATVTVNAGSTYAGSSLYLVQLALPAPGQSESQAIGLLMGSGIGGTWRALGTSNYAGTFRPVVIFQRIA